jgi:hypothetical protein
MRKFSIVFPLDLRLAFAFSLSVLLGNSVNSQALVSVFHNYHNSRGSFSDRGFSAVVSYPAIPRTRAPKEKESVRKPAVSQIVLCPTGLSTLGILVLDRGSRLYLSPPPMLQ